MRDDYNEIDSSEDPPINIGLKDEDEISFTDDSVSSESPIIESSITFLDGDDTAMASATVPHPSGASLTMRSRQRSIGSATAPVHDIVDATTGETYFETQYTYDSADDYPRQNIVTFPDNPSRKETKKLHASANQIVASGSSIGAASTSLQDWPDIA